MNNKNILLTIACILSIRSIKLQQCRRPRAAHMDRTHPWMDQPCRWLPWLYVRTLHREVERLPQFSTLMARKFALTMWLIHPTRWLKSHRSGSRMQPEIMFFKLSRPTMTAMKDVRIQSVSTLESWNRFPQQYLKPKSPPQLPPLKPLRQSTQYLRSQPTPIVVRAPAHNTKSTIHSRKVKACRLTAAIKICRAGGGCSGRTVVTAGFQIQQEQPAAQRGACR